MKVWVPYTYYKLKYFVLPLRWKGKVRTGFCKLSLIIWNGTQEIQPSPSAQALCISLCKYGICITLPSGIKPASALTY